MKKIGTMVGKNTTQQQKPLSKYHESLINRIWVKMGLLFLDNWNRNFTDPAYTKMVKQEWGVKLADIPMEKIKVGMDRLEKSGNKFPPSLPEFLAMCKDMGKGLSHESAAYKFSDVKQLTHRADREKAAAEVGKLKDLLK